MYQPYFDITSRLGTPLWWDENGVPRYEAFRPDLCADIYSIFAALLLIRCQGCRRTFPVASSWSLSAVLHDRDGIEWDKDGHNPRPKRMPTPGDGGDFGFGDAPWHGDVQCSGTTMTTDVVRVLEFWGKPKFEWVRMPEHEIHVGEDAK